MSEFFEITLAQTPEAAEELVAVWGGILDGVREEARGFGERKDAERFAGKLERIAGLMAAGLFGDFAKDPKRRPRFEVVEEP